MDKLTAVAARVTREHPQLDPESVQAGVNAALQIYSVTHERQLKWRASQGKRQKRGGRGAASR